MAATPLVPAPVYGIRAWTVIGEHGDERLAGPQRGAPWAGGGAFTHARCARMPGHAAPAAGCGCGIHAWHPTPRSARRVLAARRELPGIVEARGALEVHGDGFRAERARPHAFALLPGRNAALVGRLADAYGARVLEVRGAGDLLAFCEAENLGLGARAVEELLGPEQVAARRQARRRRARTEVLRTVAALALAALMVVLGLAFATDPPGDRVLYGRTGQFHTR
jgi:hypothetical protein